MSTIFVRAVTTSLLAILFSSTSLAQDEVTDRDPSATLQTVEESAAGVAAADSVVVMPGARYGKGGFVRFFAGRGHRDLWTVPIKVPVADLSAIGEGLAAVRLGGGMTTQTLHMSGRDGRRYVLRSVDKYPGQGLDEELRGTVYEAVLQDQISSFHPFAALVVPPLLDAVGVLHPRPHLFVVPDDERLGEFRELMAGKLVIIEERPDEGIDGGPGFAGSSRIVNTTNFFEALEESPSNRLDTERFLAARFVDLLVGDRDKSVNNWLWARFDDGDEFVWQPIPRDRDQAFIQLDGAAKAVLRMYEPRMVRFSRDVPSVVGLSRSAWGMDRPFLSGIEKARWDSILTYVQTRLSDSLIDESVRRMPSEHVDRHGSVLSARLKKRRDRLGDASEKFYRIVARYADVHATDQPEVAVVRRAPDDRTSVSLYAANADGVAADGPYFHRVFDPKETREIRLYLHGGRDRVVVEGTSNDQIKVRISGGNGRDRLENNTGGNVYFYDEGDGTEVVGGRGTRWIRRHAARPQPWGRNGPLSPDWGHRWLPRFALPYSSDLGVLAYAGAMRTGYGFLHQPHHSLLKFGFGYAPIEDKFVADVAYTLRDLRPHLHGAVRLDYTGIEILHFYGLGNDTEETLGRDFYKLHREVLRAAPVAIIPIGGATELEFDARFELSRTDDEPDEPNFVSQNRPYGSGSLMQAGGGAALRIDTRDRPIAPTRGVLLNAWASAYPELLDIDQGVFGRVGGQVATYWSVTESGNQTLAFRVGGERVFGTFPYYEAAFLGGPDRLRGFREERFAGDASLYGSAEFRLFLGELDFLLPWGVGIFGFGDTGRVFLDGESDGGWHNSAGGGIWFAPIYRRFTASVTVARSAEGTAVYAGAGFGI